MSHDESSLAYVVEAVVDATYKTNGTRRGNMTGFELYVIMVTFRGEGYPVSYMYHQENGNGL
ncbi:hypothetical protein ACHHYP_11353 [Achlya hypogyna]|uniref:Uncharacterized protein n=1 Tax=Achlya hypogyna TaxID=1202772 RepID=A0A1V9YJE0_ACHHY|nr:hypothetical protein ACHHYP_11353 [Achlya hypogyna]